MNIIKISNDILVDLEKVVYFKKLFEIEESKFKNTNGMGLEIGFNFDGDRMRLPDKDYIGFNTLAGRIKEINQNIVRLSDSLFVDISRVVCASRYINKDNKYLIVRDKNHIAYNQLVKELENFNKL